MALSKHKGCKGSERSYPHGSEIAEGGKLLECVDGRWEIITLVSGI
jgi:hypothetical protein